MQKVSSQENLKSEELETIPLKRETSSETKDQDFDVDAQVE